MMNLAKVEAASHEELIICQNKQVGLRAIMALQDTTLGSAVGGTRMRASEMEEEVIVDALRLFRGMTACDGR